MPFDTSEESESCCSLIAHYLRGPVIVGAKAVRRRWEFEWGEMNSVKLI